MTETSVYCRLGDGALQALVDEAEKQCKRNIRRFGDRDALTEGGGYEKLWLETQPMGGEMYAKRNLTVGLNNQTLFMELAREDGRLPGSIAVIDGAVTPQFNKFQGFCFPTPALNMYYLTGEKREYLLKLRDALEGFDGYLWRTRDSLGSGCLESWCVCDTGEDHALRYGDAPFWWEDDAPPAGFEGVPMISMDVTGYSYAARDTLAKIGALLGDGSEAVWRRKAVEVRERISRVMWDDERGACFDRDKRGARKPELIHNTLRLMYWGALDAEKAARFVKEHLTNPDEFWTPMPLTSVAANDPLFRNVPTNDWSGQPEGLTYQRAIRALENYGFYKLVTELGMKLIEALKLGGGVFPQQFDPYTMKPSRGSDALGAEGYGPTMLALMEYVSRMYGVHIEGREVWFGLLGGMELCYEQRIGDRSYRIDSDGKYARVSVDGAPRWLAPCGIRLVTDRYGGLLRAEDIDPRGKNDASLERVRAI